MAVGIGFVVVVFGYHATADDRLTCSPPIYGDGLKVAFHKNTLSDVCSLQQPPVKVGDISAMCSAFCETNGKTRGLPMILGSMEFGFNLDAMVSICTGIATHNQTLSSFCSEREDSLTDIKVKAAEFVGKVDIFKEEQLAFRAAMQKTSDDLRAKLESTEFQDQMTREVNKADLLRQQFDQFTQQTTDLAGADSSLFTAMKALEHSSSQLSTSVHDNLILFEEFVDTCNTMMLSTGPESEFLLDVCAQHSVACIEDDAAGHVGCCCGINPVVMRGLSYEVDGLTAAAFGGSGKVADDRRLRGTSATVDVCGQAKRDSRTKKLDAIARTLEMGGADLIAKRRNRLMYRYPSYYSQCENLGRRLEGIAERPRDDPKTAKKSVMRELSESLQCSPPVADEESIRGLKVAFSNTLESGLCNLQSPKVENSDMVAQCKDFCAPHGVPLLMGSETYGFNLTAANSICAAPSGLLIHDPDKLQQCSEWAQAFADIEVQTSGFITQLDIFLAAQLYYITELQSTTAAIKDFVFSQKFQTTMHEAIDKPQTLSAAISRKLQDSAKESKQGLDAAIKDLRAQAGSLQVSLEANMVKVQSYLTQCNSLFLGVGPQEEYLLDICRQTSTACIENPKAFHVSCCCAFHPFTAFGGAFPATTIAGVGGFEEGAEAGGGRRLADAEDDDSVEICQKAWESAAPKVRDMFTAVRKNDGTVLDEYLQQVQGEYSEYCPYEIPRPVAVVNWAPRVLPGCAIFSVLLSLLK